MNIQLGNNYSENGLFRAIDIFNHQHEYSKENIVLSFSFLYQFGHKYRKSPSKKELDDRIQAMFTSHIQQPHSDIKFLMNLVDVMLIYNKTVGETSLQAIREYQYLHQERLENERRRRNAETNNYVANVIQGTRREIAFRQQIEEDEIRRRQTAAKEIKKRTVYQDTQNVHDTTINSSVKKAVLKLVRIAKSYGDLPKFLDVKNELCNMFDGIDEPLSRIHKDNATYNIDTNIETVFLSLWVWIQKHEHVDELLLRLYQELVAMTGYCSSGHLSRLINVIQGFTDDDELTIKISDKAQVKSVVTNYLNNLLSSNPSFAEQLVDKTSELKTFVKNEITKKLPEWIDEYGAIFSVTVWDVVEKYLDVSDL
jgi:hypothetical protein